MCDVKILIGGGTGEYEEKRSRFIATIRPVHSEEQAAAFIDEMKKQYWDAKHNCSAFIVGDRNEISRCSDDGEPSGTAGRPLLDVLMKSEIHDMAVVVTRYFGGVLLGTGGLVRAYQAAVKAALLNCNVGIKTRGKYFSLYSDYNDYNKIKKYIDEKGYVIEKSDFAENVRMNVIVPVSYADAFMKDIREITMGKTRCEAGEDTEYISSDKGQI